jgi:hypothetical protein
MILESEHTPSALDNMEILTSEEHDLEKLTTMLEQQAFFANQYAQLLAHQTVWCHWQVQWMQAVQEQQLQMMLGAAKVLGSAETGGRKRRDIEEDSSSKFTTLMMRNIPNRFSRDQLLDLFDEQGFATCYDLVYLPLDFKQGVGLGYAFINFVSNAEAARFQKHFNGFSKWNVHSSKICEVSWSDARAARRLKAHSALCGVGSRTGRGVE